MSEVTDAQRRLATELGYPADMPLEIRESVAEWLELGTDRPLGQWWLRVLCTPLGKSTSDPGDVPEPFAYGSKQGVRYVWYRSVTVTVFRPGSSLFVEMTQDVNGTIRERILGTEHLGNEGKFKRVMDEAWDAIVIVRGLKVPRGKTQPHVPITAEDMIKAYRDLARESNKRPSTSALAERLLVSESTMNRRIGDLRGEGFTWPPSIEF